MKTTDQASRLAELRSRTDYTLREIEEQLRKAGVTVGISYSRVSKFEKDPTIRIKRSVLTVLARIYKTTVEYILTGVEAEKVSVAAGANSPGINTAPGYINSEDDGVDVSLANRDNTAHLLGALGDEHYVDLPFVPFTAYGSFVSGCRERKFMDLSTFRVLKRPGIDYKDAVVIEVKGNSMAPRYPDRSCHAVRPVQDGNWQYATGVHAISLRNEMFIIKRISSNREGILTLTSDSNSEEMTIQLGDILCMWKVGESVYTPAED